jgi:hypothetical protein
MRAMLSRGGHADNKIAETATVTMQRDFQDIFSILSPKGMDQPPLAA